ncbi:IS66 family transposase [Allorhodopirellula heiligendammensis]|uniref:Transposase IS66 family protein n=1 Tax=Allorhodopirellula heiligendammensis TaxID=2714739 RepID=A0A5C6BF56_9BACT|nr:IS66 family transposase [Allorhodopirellula heiligendammensis]TWU10540.1 Transposase IS66 family protein [Allorhodopirellula heiligendammensis]
MSSDAALPDSIEACHTLLRQKDEVISSLSSECQSLRQDVEQLKRYIYGQRSERHTGDDSQLTLFDQAQYAAPDNGEAGDDLEEEITYRRRKRSKSDRFPEHLPREVQTIDVPEAERACPCCGEEMPVIDTDIRERLEFVPGKMIVHELHYPKRACGKCKETVTVAPPPSSDAGAASLLSGSRYGFGVTVQTILGKFCDHLPLYRMEDVFARAGVTIPRSTQVDLLAAAADLIEPLCTRMRDRLIASPIIGMDDTPVRLQDASLPGKMRTARMWLARGRPDAPYNVFDFQTSRKHGTPDRDGPAKFLSDFEGYVCVDAYGVSDGVYLGAKDRIVASCCHAHVRRKFEAAKSNDPKRSAYALSFYRELFDIEDACAELTDEDRLAIRRERSVPLLDRFKLWLDEQAGDYRVLPKSSIGKAIRYALNQWQPLSVFTEDGGLPIHNNDTERDLRRLTIGRKNWLFLGSEAGGEVAARLYTLTASAHRHNLDMWAYINDVLRRLVGGDSDLDELLPDTWAMAHPEKVRSYREAESLARAAKTKERRARRRKLARK